MVNRFDSTRNYLAELKLVLEINKIPSNYYSIDSYADEAVCIERIRSNWYVYVGDKGRKYNKKEYRRNKKACNDVLKRLADNINLEKKMLNEFNLLINIKLLSKNIKINNDSSIDFGYLWAKSEKEILLKGMRKNSKFNNKCNKMYRELKAKFGQK